MLSPDKNLLEKLTAMTFIHPITANLSFPASVRRPSSRNDQEGPENIGLTYAGREIEPPEITASQTRGNPRVGSAKRHIKTQGGVSPALGSI